MHKHMHIVPAKDARRKKDDGKFTLLGSSININDSYAKLSKNESSIESHKSNKFKDKRGISKHTLYGNPSEVGKINRVVSIEASPHGPLKVTTTNIKNSAKLNYDD